MKPLENLLVVSLEQAVAAPLASCRLADAGARVNKIERPGGDFARGYDDAVFGQASYFVWINRGKESLVLDLVQGEDRALLHRILARADVWIQNLAPGAAGRLGFGSELLRETYPRLITCDISGYGEGGYEDMKAYDLLVQCESGLVAISGSPEGYGRIGVSVCDIGTGMNAHSAILEALLRRASTGRGSGVKTSLFATAADWMSVPFLQAVYGGRPPGRVGLRHPTISPYGGFRTRDGHTLVISIQNNREWAALCREILDRPQMIADPRFATNTARVENRSEVDAAVGAAFARHDRAELAGRLRAAGIAFGAVNQVEELADHPALHRRPMPVGGRTADLIAPPFSHGDDPAAYPPAPALGEHTEAIRREFAP